MTDRPNILLIMDDQHRYDWLGCAGADWVNTPNIDALAARGAHMTHCFTNSPVCVAARVSLATGMLPMRTGMVDNSGYLRRSHATYYQRLRDADYRVGCVGKLHMNRRGDRQSPRGDGPRCYTWGFTHPEEHEGKCEAGLVKQPTGIYTHTLAEQGLLDDFIADYRKRQKIGWPIANDDSILPTEYFQDYWTGTRAARWLENIADDRPWHLFASFGGPHDPFDPPTEFAERYRDADIPEPYDDPMTGKPPSQAAVKKVYPPDAVMKSRRQYAACIEVVDDRVGAMIDVLKQRGMFDNTIVIFTSDHGELLGDHGMWRKRWFYEQAMRVPLIAAGPGVKQCASDALVELSDVNATICDMAGLPAQLDIDARSFAPVLRGESDEHRDAVISQIDVRQCIRTRTHKAVRTPNEANELYDLENDPKELHNCFDDQPDVAQAMMHGIVDRHFDNR